MKLLQEYCIDELIIDGLKTYIISPEHYENLLHDTMLLEQLSISDVGKEFIPRMIEYAKQISEIKIYFAFVQHENFAKRFMWEPVNVCKFGDDFYHIFIRNNWLCRECGHNHLGKIIMPMFEADSVFLDKRNIRTAAIPTIFNKIPCEKCGKLLQNHLFIIKEMHI